MERDIEINKIGDIENGKDIRKVFKKIIPSIMTDEERICVDILKKTVTEAFPNFDMEDLNIKFSNYEGVTATLKFPNKFCRSPMIKEDGNFILETTPSNTSMMFITVDTNPNGVSNKDDIERTLTLSYGTQTKRENTWKPEVKEKVLKEKIEEGMNEYEAIEYLNSFESKNDDGNSFKFYEYYRVGNNQNINSIIKEAISDMNTKLEESADIFFQENIPISDMGMVNDGWTNSNDVEMKLISLKDRGYIGKMNENMYHIIRFIDGYKEDVIIDLIEDYQPSEIEEIISKYNNNSLEISNEQKAYYLSKYELGD